MQIVLIIVFIGLNAIFAASEIALVSVNENKVNADAENGNKKAIKVQYFMHKSTNFLSAIQIGITLLGFLNGALAADAFSEALVNSITNATSSIPVNILRPVITFLVMLVLTYFQVVFGEIVPKRLAMRAPEKVSYATVSIVKVIATIMRPFVWVLTASANLVLRIFGVKPGDDENQITEEEIRLMLSSSEKKGVIDENENEMIQNIFEFDNTTVSEIMTHRTEVSAVNIKITKEELIQFINSERYTRFPVYDESIDNIVGIIHVKDVFRYFSKKQETFEIQNVIREAYYVPDSKNVSELFKEMKAQKIHIAVVIDEYGGTAGIVTIEDLIEEILGDIDDEYDDEEIEIEHVSNDEYLIDGLTDLDDVEDEIHANLPVEDYDTLSGFMLGQLGRFPEDDEKIVVEYNGYQFEGITYEDRVVVSVKVTKLEPKEEITETEIKEENGNQ
ncbi:Membrane-anchored CBS-domain containing protein [Alteracholeplasma palmae J233]|uniref:Membrane-anchored CBS-domain containing protein n=1 Tax=Alteracholeplasma palmae (strain ATCC 49389 / J233) TaxID=1318466 RepID=U4KRT3_ALTPJ|nr:hemolysin family protein [Alteracholeplasma palmae]CCV64416.1 Membrane-anchored CBS-domain containing protein [Alteracholeplasma palmae J233]